MLELWFFANTILWPISVEISGLRLSLNVIVLVLVGVVWILGKARLAKFSTKAFFVLGVYIIFSYVAAISGPCTDKFQKFLFTTPTLFLLILIGLEAGWRANDVDWIKLQKISQWILLASFAGFILEILFPGSFPESRLKYHVHGSYSGIFNEPSHVAFSLFPSIAILLLADKKKMRQKGMLALLGLFVVSRSSTLIALTLTWISYRLYKHGSLRRMVLAVLGISLIVMLAAVVDYNKFLEPTINRAFGLAGLGETETISSLVYVQGWQDAWFNFQRTNGLGLGFNMMGCSPLPDVAARDILTKGLESGLNDEDGSFLFSKLTSENGFFCILFLIAILWWFKRLENANPGAVYGVNTAAITIQNNLIFLFLISAFVRGGNYFNAEMLLWIPAISASVKWYKYRYAQVGGKFT